MRSRSRSIFRRPLRHLCARQVGHTPLYEVSPSGPFDRWPSGEGFSFLRLHGPDATTIARCSTTPMADGDWVGKQGYTSRGPRRPRHPNITANVSASPRPAVHDVSGRRARCTRRIRSKGIYLLAIEASSCCWDKARGISMRGSWPRHIPRAPSFPTAEGYPGVGQPQARRERMYARQMEVFAGMMTQTDEQRSSHHRCAGAYGPVDNTSSS